MATQTFTNRAVTIVDVALEAEVSKSTVSLVLKGSALIRGDTAERVKAAATKLGYVYNRRAGELRGKSSNAIAVLINDLMNPFFAEILVGIERKLVDAGYVVLMAHTNENLEIQEKVLQSMREQNAAGIMLCPATSTPRGMLKKLHAWGIPLMIFVRNAGPGHYDFAGPDNEAGMFMATTHLLDAGYTRVGFLGGLEGVVFKQRLAGYQAALLKRNIAFNPDWVLSIKPNRQGGYESMNRLLNDSPEVAAAVCYNDIVAFGALAALGERGLRAGKDFSLMGFDNLQDSAHSNPPLSTIDIQPAQLGEQAATMLLKRIENPNIKRQLFSAKPNLVIRQTT
jgi:LacI family transcriptional regulator